MMSRLRDFYPQVNLIIKVTRITFLKRDKLINETYLAAADRYGYYLGCIDLAA